MALCVLIGVPFTLWWWRTADNWADAESRRFKPKTDDSLKDAVVVTWITHDSVTGAGASAAAARQQSDADNETMGMPESGNSSDSGGDGGSRSGSAGE